MGQGGATQATEATERARIPADVQRKLLLQCGFTCSIPQCQATEALGFHYINGDHSDVREANLLVLCRVHRRVARTPGSRLDQRACERLKETVAETSRWLVVARKVLWEAWRRLQTGRLAPAKRRELLEYLAKSLLASVPGFVVVEARVRRPDGEAEIAVRNEAADGVLSQLGRHIVVQCTARRSQRVRITEMADFLRRVARNGWTAGFLFSSSGFTSNALAVAESSSGKDFLIALFGPAELVAMIEAEDRVETVKHAICW